MRSAGDLSQFMRHSPYALCVGLFLGTAAILESQWPLLHKHAVGKRVMGADAAKARSRR